LVEREEPERVPHEHAELDGIAAPRGLSHGPVRDAESLQDLWGRKGLNPGFDPSRGVLGL
jgi:hypothetical protein